MMKTKNKVQWFLALFAGCVLGYLAFMGTISAINLVFKSTYVNEVSDTLDPNIKFEEQVIIDNGSYKVTVLGLNTLNKDQFNNELDLRIENTSNTTYSFMPGTVKVNGYKVSTTLVENVEPNATKDVSLHIATKLKDFGIEKISDMELGFFINDEATNDYFYDGGHLIKSNYYGEYDQEQAFSEKNTVELYNDNQFKVSLVTDMEQEMKIYPLILENLTDHNINLTDIKFEVNGVIVNASSYPEDIPPKTKALEAIDLYFNDIEKDKIGDTLKSLNVSFGLTIIEPETYNIIDEYDTMMFKVK